jgi:hypothetical protein
MVVLNYIALHGPGAEATFASLYPPATLNNTLGTSALALDPLIAYQPLASLVNGRVT